MIASALGAKEGESFRLGYVAGLTHYLTMLYWLLLIPYRWHGLPLGPGLGWLALGAFLALFPATWTWMVTPGRSRGDAKDGPFTPNNTASAGLGRVLPRNWFLRVGWTLCGAAGWVV
jgi:hypothetical protein